MKFTRVTVNLNQMGGVPCIRGLRIPVATVVGLFADGFSAAEILAAYPDLTGDDIQEALRFAAETVRERTLPLTNSRGCEHSALRNRAVGADALRRHVLVVLRLRTEGTQRECRRLPYIQEVAAPARVVMVVHQRGVIRRTLVEKSKAVVPTEADRIKAAILVVRGQRVILDADLAALYGVTTKRLNEQVKRNSDRFPQDFLFRFSRTEAAASNRSQIATGCQKHRDPRFPPLAFTEHGAIMAATILNSQRAVEMSLYVVRAFVQLRELLTSNTELARRLDELERKLEGHDESITAILSAIRELMNPPDAKRRGIGFTADLEPTT